MNKTFKATLTVTIDMTEDGWDRAIKENIHVGIQELFSNGDITGMTPCEVEEYNITVEQDHDL